MSPAPRSTVLSAIVRAAARGLALVAVVQLPGALADASFRHALGEPFWLWLRVAGAAAVALVVATLFRRARRHGLEWALALAVAGAVALAFTRVAVPSVEQSRRVLDAYHLGLYQGDIHDCRLRPRCHDYRINEFGLRRPTAMRAGPGDRVVAMVGDSHVFGYGVEDDETLPSAVARRLAALRPPTVVANAGMEGTSLVTFPDLMRYANHVFAPDLFVVLIKGDDLEPDDHNSRLLDLRDSVRARVIFVLNLDPVLQVARQLSRVYVHTRPDAGHLVERLDATRRAAGLRGLLLVTDLDGDLAPTVARWMARHPEVGWYATSDATDWSQAPKIPHDGHWSPAGNEVIAADITPAIARMLDSGSPPRPQYPLGRGGRPDPSH